MFSNKNFYTEVIAPLSIIRATKEFDAQIFELFDHCENYEDTIKRFPAGTRLRVELVFKPIEICKGGTINNAFELDYARRLKCTELNVNDGCLLCHLADSEVESRFYESILPAEYINPDYNYDREIRIEWDVFFSSFEVEKLFDLNNLDYRNGDQRFTAVVQYYYDKSFPLKVPKETLDEIERITEEEFYIGFITENEYHNIVSMIVRDALGFND